VAGSKYVVQLDGDKALATGALIPSGTDVKLPGGAASVALRPEVGGRQGQLWAIAPMLAEGSQSWSMRLVAGADLAAADSRIVQTRPAHGDLRLADSHYGMYGAVVPPKSSGFMWNQKAADELGLTAGETITDEFAQELTEGRNQTAAELCAENVDFCTPKFDYVWTQKGVDEYGKPNIKAGDVLDPVALNMPSLCTDNPGWCATVGGGFNYIASSTRMSVLRTGTGDLELLSGGNLRVDSLYGVYTAGQSSTATVAGDPYNLPRNKLPGTVLNDPDGLRESLVDGSAGSIYRAWYPDQGGNLLLKVGGDLRGAQMNTATTYVGRPLGDYKYYDAGFDSGAVGNWLWRQGSGAVATGTAAQPTAWWINFGSYVGIAKDQADKMVGFTGFGTLGGGNLSVQVAGDAGYQSLMAGPVFDVGTSPRSQALVLAVGSTGRVAADGSMQLTGGGDLDVRIGGRLNPASTDSTAINGALINLRGNAQLSSAQLGSMMLTYGSQPGLQVPKETRAVDPFHATRGEAAGGITLVPGDATFSVATLGDQVVQTVLDPGRVLSVNNSAFVSSGVVGRGYSWFTLWTDRTALDLFSAGGSLTPYRGASGTDDAVMYPATVRAVAASGSLFYGKAASGGIGGSDLGFITPLLLAPAAHGQLQFLAADSIYAGGFTVSQSGRPPVSWRRRNSGFCRLG